MCEHVCRILKELSSIKEQVALIYMQIAWTDTSQRNLTNDWIKKMHNTINQ